MNQIWLYPFLNIEGLENLMYGVESVVDGEPNQVFKLIGSVLGNVAEMERTNLRERQLEGIAVAKANGLYKGRQRGSSMDTQELLEKYKHVTKEIKNHPGLAVRKLAKITSVRVGTAQRVKKVFCELQVDFIYNC